LTTAKKILANGISEQEAIDRAKQGDSGCFEALYGLHKRRVYSLCLRMVGNTAEAEDLTQEAFLQLFRKIATFRGESAFSTWLHRLAVNVVLMHLRKKGLPEVSLEETLEPSIGSTWSAPSRVCHRDTASSSCCMMSKVTNTTKLRR
jgi:DNA-directed RNA polymerase specialized sigma24 family protein